MKTILLLVAYLFSIDAFARCGGSTMATDLKGAEIVFVVKAVNSSDLTKLGSPNCSSMSSGAESLCTYQVGPIVNLVNVEEVIKGKVSSGKRAFILQEDTLNSISIENDKRYLIFVRKVGEELYVLPACSNSFAVGGNENRLHSIRAMAKSK